MPIEPLENASKQDLLNTPSYTDVYGDPTVSASYTFDTEGSMLPEGFRDVQVWRDLADSMDEVLGLNIGGLLKDLLGLNDITYLTTSPTIDLRTKLERAKSLGVVNDLTLFSETDLNNFLRYTPEFWKEKGNRDFIQYMSFVINAQISIKYLWTENYEDFYPEGNPSIGTPVYEGGTWYQTSHVFISYDVSKFSGTVNSNFTSQEALSRFFYTIAPIQLVIKSFVLTIIASPYDVFFGLAAQLRVWSGDPVGEVTPYDPLPAVEVHYLDFGPAA